MWLLHITVDITTHPCRLVPWPEGTPLAEITVDTGPQSRREASRTIPTREGRVRAPLSGPNNWRSVDMDVFTPNGQPEIPHPSGVGSLRDGPASGQDAPSRHGPIDS